MERKRTRESLSASGCPAMYPRSSPPGIHSEMSSRGSVVAPRKGTTFGCFKCFDIAATWLNVWGIHECLSTEGTYGRARTSLAFCWSPPGHTLTRLMRTFNPSKVPSYTHPRRDSGTVHDSGRTSLTPHIFLRSCSDRRNKTLVRSEMSVRIWNSVELSATKEEVV